VFQWPPGSSGSYLIITFPGTSGPTSFKKANDYGNVPRFNSTKGISAGSFVLNADQTTIPISTNDNKGLQVTAVTADSVTLNGPIRTHKASARLGADPGKGRSASQRD
jgi:hypothetical protein